MNDVENKGGEAGFVALGNERFVSLTTFRRSGAPVATPVWVARDGDMLIVTTPEASGKVKRLRNNARVELRPCSRLGKVNAAAVPVTGVAEIVTDQGLSARLTDMIRTKYGIEYRIVMGIERLLERGQRPRVIVRITRD